MEDETPIATAEDFKRIARERSRGEPERLTLPSGLTVIVRRPSPLWWMLERGSLPQSLAARSAGVAPTEILDNDELVDVSRFMVKLITEMVVEPKIRENATNGDVDPRWITDTDFSYLMKYAGGEIAADGRDLAAFRSESDAIAVGPGGGAVEGAAEFLG